MKKLAELIRTKSLSSPIDPDKDGVRILITRYHPRGFDKWGFKRHEAPNRYAWFMRMPELAPSKELLREYKAGNIDWMEYSIKFKNEMGEPKAILSLMGLAAQILLNGRPLTLICHCKTDKCHRFIVRDIILDYIESLIRMGYWSVDELEESSNKYSKAIYAAKFPHRVATVGGG